MKWNILYLDPPWRFKNWSMKELEQRGEKWARANGRSPYEVCSPETMKSWDIISLCDTDCLMFMWTTYPKLNEAFELVTAWNEGLKKSEQLQYKTVAFTWVKTNRKSPGYHFGLGYWTRQNPEVCLLFGRGKLKRINNKIENLVISPLEHHSKKPDIVRDKIVQLVGDLPRIEIFARNEYKGWDATGLELDKLDIAEFIRRNNENS